MGLTFSFTVCRHSPFHEAHVWSLLQRMNLWQIDSPARYTQHISESAGKTQFRILSGTSNTKSAYRFSRYRTSGKVINYSSYSLFSQFSNFYLKKIIAELDIATSH